ncbi:uncharacterized protein LOC143782028 [Ranitomeya variabilis]|uniref:uncharacterized protein LOC143782028 n=1 Tax=Ranitomeya variabilis TaxID=490064 RepID=UPI00405617C5
MASRYGRLGTSEKWTPGRKSHLQISFLIVCGILGCVFLDIVEVWTPGVQLTSERVPPLRSPGDWNVYNVTKDGRKNFSDILAIVNITLSNTSSVWMYGPVIEELAPYNYPGRKYWPSTVLTNGTGTVKITHEDNIACWEAEMTELNLTTGLIESRVYANYTSRRLNDTSFIFCLNGTKLIVCFNMTDKVYSTDFRTYYPNWRDYLRIIQVMCRYVVLSLMLGLPGNIFFWMPKFNGPYVDNNNKTYDLSICEDTLEGKTCKLHLVYVKFAKNHIITTTIISNKMVKMGSVIANATSHYWYDIFLGYSPSAKKMLDWVIHPLLVVMIIVIILSIWNCYMAYKVFCRRPKVLMVTYGNGK